MRVTGPAAQDAPLEAAPPHQGEAARLAEAARQFEALLVAQLLKAARADSEGWMGAGEDTSAASVLELAEEQFAAALAAQGGLGLAGLIVSGLSAPPEPGLEPRG
ncbi:MAG: hypothetical protein IT159_05650 [Bryobacterales bacterium]|nr:hypothetical protein [Bryobacterales bacterium]